jgi:homoserine kinase
MAPLTVDVPATLSNLGPGYDTLGLAVDLTNTFHLEPAEGWWAEGQRTDPDEHLTLATARRAAERFGGQLRGLAVRQEERVPRARGLGSSATARVAGLWAALRLGGARAPVDEQIAFLSEEEGHPDNVAPALLGGLVAVRTVGGRPHALSLGCPSLSVALCVPDREVSTPLARERLPRQVAHGDAVANLGSLAFLLAGLLRDDPEALALGLDDRLHQPYRAPLIGPVDESLAAAREAGAIGAFVSGSGSTLAAFVAPDGPVQAVAEALARPFRGEGGPGARALGVRPRATGAR